MMLPRDNPGKHRAALVSVHDVMPETQPRIASIVQYLVDSGVKPFTLFVVPGKKWRPQDIRTLERFVNLGRELAGHGWSHRSQQMTTLFHIIHGQVISRNEAEHLSLSEQEIAEKINLCHSWFNQWGFTPPDLYTAPAWAMGSITRKTLQTLPFNLYENQWGVYDVRSPCFYPLPVTGYMADRPWRIMPLKISNALNLSLNRPVTRIALHPFDLSLPLFRDLSSHLKRFNDFCSYSYFSTRMKKSGREIRTAMEAR